MEQSFLKTWRDFQRALKQRNLSIKQRRPLAEISLWDTSFSGAGKAVTEMRKSYLTRFEPLFRQVLAEFLEISQLDMKYERGWPAEVTLMQAMNSEIQRDLQVGHTQSGPHRADLVFLVDGVPAKDILSRGQQKLFVYALRLAQGMLFKQDTKQCPIYLVDDLSAELDEKKRSLVVDFLRRLDAQVFITNVDKGSVARVLQYNTTRVFHVEQGVFSAEPAEAMVAESQ